MRKVVVNISNTIPNNPLKKPRAVEHPKKLLKPRKERTSTGLMKDAFICIGPTLKMKDVRVAVNSTEIWLAFVMLAISGAPIIR